MITGLRLGSGRAFARGIPAEGRREFGFRGFPGARIREFRISVNRDSPRHSGIGYSRTISPNRGPRWVLFGAVDIHHAKEKSQNE